MRGFNITLPHKERAATLVDSLEGDAADIRAVNVVAARAGNFVGFNTDTLAVTRSLEKAQISAEGRRALVLGAGGAARAAAYALAKAGASEIVVANRNFARARELSSQLAGSGCDVIPSPLSAAAVRELVPLSQIVVNATSLGLNEPDASPLPFDVNFDPSAIAIDMIYRPLKTRFLMHAREQGIQTVDGVEILVHQAIGSLAIWLNRAVDPVKLFPLMRAAALEALL
jgi:shikimate dehydrogenase